MCKKHRDPVLFRGKEKPDPFNRAALGSPDNKPRVKFCWECGKKLWLPRFSEALVDGHYRIFHKTCLKNIQKESK